MSFARFQGLAATPRQFIQLNMPKKITQKMVAHAAKVDPSTVCLALNNSPNLPAATRDRIIEIADKLGYRRDPMMGALAAYRRTHAVPVFHGVLGWLVNTEGGYDWRIAPQYREYYAGAKEQAEKLGYQIVLLDLNDYRENPQRLNGVLRARNICGLLVCPQPHMHTLLIQDFEDMSAVTFGYTVKSPRLHMVTSPHYAAMREAICELRERGYRRIGYVIPDEHNERLNRNYMAGFLIEQSTWPAAEQLAPFIELPRLEPFRAWLLAQKPDAVITTHYGFPELIAALKIKVPEKLGVVVTSLVDSVRNYTGIDEDCREVGRVAACLLASLVERGEKGLPSRPQCVLVQGAWSEGRTLRPRPPEKSKPIAPTQAVEKPAD